MGLFHPLLCAGLSRRFRTDPFWEELEASKTFRFSPEHDPFWKVLGLAPSQDLNRPSIIDRTAGRDLNKARVRRESSDYADFYLVSKEESYNQLEAAKRFVKTIKSSLEDELPE